MANVVKHNELHRIVMTAIIYNDEGRFLVTKRTPTQKAFPNLWTVPGGGLEVSDYIDTPKTTSDLWYFVLEKALRREVVEEVNVEIGKPRYLLDMIFIRPDGIPAVVLSYYAKYISGEVKLDPEDSTEYRWVTADEAKDLEMIEGIPEEIGMVDKILAGEEDPEFNLKV